jgi:ferrous iron transport protein B
MKTPDSEFRIPLRTPLYRGKRRLRIALVGMPSSGRSTLFKAVASTSVQKGVLAGTEHEFEECTVQVGLDEARLIDLPSIQTLHRPQAFELAALKYLLWGNTLPPVSLHESEGPPAPFAPPEAIIQVVDATALGRHLELTLELRELGRPMVIALNMMDKAAHAGLHINAKALSEDLGVPVVPMVALMGHGIAELFAAAVEAARQQSISTPLSISKHIYDSLLPLSDYLSRADLLAAFRVPQSFLLLQVAEGNGYFLREMQHHFPELLPELGRLRSDAERSLPRPLGDELHADRHHQAASLAEAAARLGPRYETRGWRYWADELFLHPRWGFVGSLAVFALVLIVVFELSTWLDSVSSAKLVIWASLWQPQSTVGVVGRAVVDGLIGLVGIVVPYMIPLVLLLVALEEAGIMQRIAFVVDRAFHHIGLHGAVAVPFLLGLGCNVPAISAAARTTRGNQRIVAAVLITFVPCSARSAIILALAGKYLGALGVLSIFFIAMMVIAILGRILSRRLHGRAPGQVQEIPAYALPKCRTLLVQTWNRTSDVLTIVTPLLVGGSVVLALLGHVGADRIFDALLTPITHWWLGLPIVLGVPILFGVLRKELSLLMVYQALGTFDIGAHLTSVQIITFLIFLTLYVPCISTFAVMLKSLGRKQAWFSVSLSVGVALLVSGAVRFILEGARYLVA